MSSTVLWVLFYILASLLASIYLHSRRVFSYFRRRRIPYEQPSFPFGNLYQIAMLKKSYNEVLFDMYKKHKGKKLIGFFQFFQKSVLIIDRELIKQVLVKNFEEFSGKNIHYNREVQPLTAHLFALDGSEWKFLRMKMSPAFSSGKLKFMFPLMTQVSEDLLEYLTKLTAENDVIDCKEAFIRYGIAMVSNTAFGVESDVFLDKSSMFYKVCQAIMSPTLGAMCRNALMFYGKAINDVVKMKILPKDTHEFIMKMVTDVVQYREVHKKERNDFLQILMQMKQGVKVETTDVRITMDELAAQAYVFILAGFETVSNTMSFFLYELALNPEVQRRVQAEVDQAETLTFETIGSMEYLDMAIDETLRKYASLGFLGRVCTQDFPIPGTDDVIEKGTHVMVSIHGLHWDPDLFPDPERFIPERFSKENKSDIKPYSYMPFGGGPRICIGMRFGKLVVKVGLAMLLRNFTVERTSKTPYPLKYEVKTINTTAKGGIWVRFMPRVGAASRKHDTL